MHLVSEQHHSNTTYSLSSLIINEGDIVQRVKIEQLIREQGRKPSPVYYCRGPM